MTHEVFVYLKSFHKLFPKLFFRMVIRIRCDATDAQCQLGNKFGCDPVTEAPEILRVARKLNINVVGVSFHVGSGCGEPASFRRAIAASRKLFDFAETLGFDFSLLDLGGGYPGDRATSIDKVSWMHKIDMSFKITRNVFTDC